MQDAQGTSRIEAGPSHRARRQIINKLAAHNVQEFYAMCKNSLTDQLDAAERHGHGPQLLDDWRKTLRKAGRL